MIVQPSTMQRVAAELGGKPLAESERQVATAQPSKIGERVMTPLRYSEITPAMLSVLRRYREVESAYPQDGDRATRTLAGYEDWRRKRVGGHLRSSGTNPGIDHRNLEQNQGPSRANSSGSRPLRGVKSESQNHSEGDHDVG